MLHSTDSLIFVVSAFTAPVAAILLIYAWRGRLIDNHPLCRKCGFDLFGLPETSSNCPECGRDVRRRRATRRGHRRKRGRLLAASLLVLLVSAAPFASVGVRRARGAKWIELKPVFWLLRDTRLSPQSADVAVDEILRRLRASKLSADDVRSLAEVALAHQADRAQPWMAKWGTFLEEAKAAGRLDPAAWTRYVEQAADRYALETRDTISLGAPIPIRLRALPERVGTPGRFAYFPRVVYHVDGQQLLPLVGALDYDTTERRAAWSTGYLDSILPLPHPAVMTLRAGEHAAGVNLRVLVIEDQWRLATMLSSSARPVPHLNAFATPDLVPRNGPSGRAVTEKDLEKNYAPVRRDTRLARPFRIAVADDAPRVAPVYEERMAGVVQGSIRPAVSWDGPNRLSVQLDFRDPPVDLAFHGRLAWKDDQYDLGLIVVRAGAKEEHVVVAVPLGPDLRRTPDRVDITLLPDPAAAETTVDINRIWAGVVFLNDLAVPSPQTPTYKRR